MQGLRAVVRKELIHIRREPRLVGYVLGLPVIILLLFGFALRVKVDDLVVAVWDQDHSFFSLTVKDHLQNEGGMRIAEVESEGAINDMLRKGHAHMGLIIPPDFSKRIFDNQQTDFKLFVDGTMPTIALAALYGSRVLTSPEATRAMVVDDPDHPADRPRVNPIKIEEIILYNPKMRDSDFFLPGTIGIVIMLVTLSLTTGIVREREQQTIEQLWATPLTRFALIGGKMLPYAAVTALDATMALSLSLGVFKLPVHGSFAGIVALTSVFILALLALGTLVSVLSETQLQASFINIFVFVLSICMSGFVFPIEAMPRALQPAAWALPMTYFLDGIRALTLKGSPVHEVLGDFAALGVMFLLLGTLSLTSMKKQIA
jgi:ABC-type multidrug transport system permease subunit